MIPAPEVSKTEMNCIDVTEDGFLSLMDQETGELKEDIKLPHEEHLKDIANRIKSILAEGKKECLVTIQKWGEREQAVLCREGGDA